MGIEGKVCSISVDNASYSDAVGLSEIEDVIENVRESVKHIAASTARLTMFSDIVKQLQLPNKRLILDCCTRWNATYSMLSCAMEFKDVFLRYVQRDVSYLSSDEDWMRVEEVCSFLALFNEVNNIISDSKYPTSNLFLPELWSIKELLMEKSLSGEL
ncbi:zinc finger BED domain-containing protein RICESLEEPER 2-like [Hibiscus syriacus]|uniref:zinc finger BED domain-containing protein RICESLEEPER 2-like n=1 Tax=Hibiscus syriacus TaxID=106335 RepID=UPI00192077F9|nr:zinc finger BED domain-containing protein RICESLEEPER 2-like [Hibiscus syriacus]